jgi:hypothetical protein
VQSPPLGAQRFGNLNKKPLESGSLSGAPTEIRTLVLALKGLRPGPLDDGGNNGQILSQAFTIGQEIGENSSDQFPGRPRRGFSLQCVEDRLAMLRQQISRGAQQTEATAHHHIAVGHGKVRLER